MTTRHIRFLEDGMTLDGQVWRVGAVCATEDPFAELSEEEQVRRYGFEFFETLTQDQYEAMKDQPSQVIQERRRARLAPPPPAMAHDDAGGERHVDPGKAAPLPAQGIAMAPLVIDTAPTPEQLAKIGVPVEPAQTPSASVDPYPWYKEANVPQTLMQVAGMGDGVGEFLEYEKTHKNRKQVIEAIENGD